MDEYYIRLSKTISHALRHKPGEYGLQLDAEGWVSVEKLLDALRRRRNAWEQVSVADIERIIAESEKQRFEMDNGKIRAYYGHSTSEKIDKQLAIPPTFLYHGTTAQAAETIRREGLKSINRQYVHLSTDQHTARTVARRRTSQPVILCIAALDAHQQGVHFYLGNEDIWLADPIPPEFIRG